MLLGGLVRLGYTPSALGARSMSCVARKKLALSHQELELVNRMLDNELIYIDGRVLRLSVDSSDALVIFSAAPEAVLEI